ncbi:hypothetical protein MLD38_004223 [Melastoma candidum]|uniref:Uncharacterized protein n=1 Tax=Melastoma candidum TaxID=119954 RepID=A0ACB9S4Y5_9MYRT|nr:hypothetical protein MLD38_004223 [Melastoma candidum]
MLCCYVLHACYTKVSPSAEVEDPQLVAWSVSVAESLDLDPEEEDANSMLLLVTDFKDRIFPLLFSGAPPLAGSLPSAQGYEEHQFSMWVGAGKTPYSRFADGPAMVVVAYESFSAVEQCMA